MSAPLPPSPMLRGQLFQPGGRIANGEEFAAAVMKAQDAYSALRQYLNALRSAEGDAGIEQAARCSYYLVYSRAYNVNKYERALVTLTGQLKRNIELYPYSLAVDRKIKIECGCGKKSQPLERR